MIFKYSRFDGSFADDSIPALVGREEDPAWSSAPTKALCSADSASMSEARAVRSISSVCSYGRSFPLNSWRVSEWVSVSFRVEYLPIECSSSRWMTEERWRVIIRLFLSANKNERTKRKRAAQLTLPTCVRSQSSDDKSRIHELRAVGKSVLLANRFFLIHDNDDFPWFIFSPSRRVASKIDAVLIRRETSLFAHSSIRCIKSCHNSEATLDASSWIIYLAWC